MITKHGPAFRAQYGWASKDLRKDNPTFADIERSVEFDHFPPYYKMASHGVHANPKGVFFHPGMMDHVNILMVGPTNFGLADPGQNTVLSLAQVTSVLVQLTPNFDRLLLAQVINEIAVEAGEAFLAVQREIERDEGKARKCGPVVVVR